MLAGCIHIAQQHLKNIRLTITGLQGFLDTMNSASLNRISKMDFYLRKPSNGFFLGCQTQADDG